MNDTERTCRYGHGPLVTPAATWALDGISWEKGSPEETLRPYRNNQVFTVRLAVCPQCGYIELIDAPVGSA